MRIEHPYLEKIIDWARREEPIRAVVITGSLARGDGSTDEFSDLDAQIITTDRQRYSADDSWLDGLGPVWIRFPLAADAPYRLVWFAGGIKVDFQFIALDSLRPLLESGELSEEYQRGYWVALDKDGLYRALPPSPRRFPPPPSPSAAAVQATINEFWFEAIHVAQFIRRREFWVLKFRDWTMKEMLLRLLEWTARAQSDGAVNTWLLGKRIEQWTDAVNYAAIAQLWPGWDAAALWQALLRQVALFRRLSLELNAALGYEYSDSAYAEIEGYIRRLRAEDEL